MAAEHGIGMRAFRGAAWAYGSYLGGRLLVLISTAILARLLTPSDFGVVALALVFMTFLETIKDLGLTQALIIEADEGEEQARAQTVFSWTVALGGGLSLSVAAIAPLVARFFDQDQLSTIIPVLGLSFFVQAIGATHYSLARKELDYRVRTIAEVGDVLVRGAVGITLALLGAGAWSLVLGYLAGTIVRSSTLWILVPFRPRLRLSRTHLRELVRFGGVLTLVDIGSAVVHNLDYLFVGRLLGASALGAYSLGFRLPELLIMNLAVVAGDVLFPAYAKLDASRLKEGFLISLRFTALLVLPAGVGLAILARPVIQVLFGDQWEAAVGVTPLLAAYAVLATLSIPAGTIFKVTGRALILVVMTVPYVIVLFALLMAFADQGIVAVAACLLACQSIGALAGLAVARRVLDVPYVRIVGALAGPAVAATGLAVVLLALRAVLGADWTALVAGVVLGGLAYAGLVWLVARDAVLRLRDMAFSRRPGLAGIATTTTSGPIG